MRGRATTGAVSLSNGMHPKRSLWIGSVGELTEESLFSMFAEACEWPWRGGRGRVACGVVVS